MIVAQRHWIVATVAALAFFFFVALFNRDHIQKLSDTSKQGLGDPPERPFTSSTWVSPGRVAIIEEYKKSDLIPLDTHNVVYSESSSDGKYMFVDFRGSKSFNPNVIPHPTLNDTWVVVAQRWKHPDDHHAWFTELICNARFENDTLACINYPSDVPIAATSTAGCADDIAFFTFNVGPHDARVFMGPEQPFIMYGSQSPFNCFGLWTQDFRMVMDWGTIPDSAGFFTFPTNLQRPPPYSRIEKNWFLFWDSSNTLYAHYDVQPHRVFSLVKHDGSHVSDLGSITGEHDNMCLDRHLESTRIPGNNIKLSIHQATNSLRVTMCRRSDPKCVPTADNTFIMSIIHHQRVARLHGVYSPFVFLFKQDAPFGMHAYGEKPIWVKGRSMPGEQSSLRFIPEDQSEQFYVTSMNWKDRGLNYHGYLDDVIILGIGLEDTMSGVIDVRAENLIGDLMLC